MLSPLGLQQVPVSSGWASEDRSSSWEAWSVPLAEGLPGWTPSEVSVSCSPADGSLCAVWEPSLGLHALLSESVKKSRHQPDRASFRTLLSFKRPFQALLESSLSYVSRGSWYPMCQGSTLPMYPCTLSTSGRWVVSPTNSHPFTMHLYEPQNSMCPTLFPPNNRPQKLNQDPLTLGNRW